MRYFTHKNKLWIYNTETNTTKFWAVLFHRCEDSSFSLNKLLFDPEIEEISEEKAKELFPLAF